MINGSGNMTHFCACLTQNSTPWVYDGGMAPVATRSGLHVFFLGSLGAGHDIQELWLLDLFRRQLICFEPHVWFGLWLGFGCRLPFGIGGHCDLCGACASLRDPSPTWGVYCCACCFCPLPSPCQCCLLTSSSNMMYLQGRIST